MKSTPWLRFELICWLIFATVGIPQFTEIVLNPSEINGKIESSSALFWSCCLSISGLPSVSGFWDQTFWDGILGTFCFMVLIYHIKTSWVFHHYMIISTIIPFQKMLVFLLLIISTYQSAIANTATAIGALHGERNASSTGWLPKGRGTRDHIANLRWLMEVSREYQKNVYLCFINYSKAFDCINHNRLWLSLRSMEILEHLIVLMKNLYEGQEATVCTSHGDTEWFGIGKGVWQGCILSPYLFNLYAEKIMHKAELDEDGTGVRVGRLRLTNLWYADDTTLMTESSEDLKMLITKVKEESANAGLYLNIKKTKVMMTDDTSEFQMDGDKIEVVQSFNFLSSLVNKDSTSSEEIKRRLNLARVAMVKLKYLMKSSRLTKESKIKMVRTLVFPIAMYGCESWTFRKQDRHCIDAFELWCWMRVLKIPWTKKERNKSVVQKIQPKSSLEVAIVKQRLKYFGHIIRKDSSLEKSLMITRCDGQWVKGRPHQQWMEGITKPTGLKLSCLGKLAKNRDKWRKIMFEVIKSHPWLDGT